MGGSKSMKPHAHIVWDWNGTLMDDAWLCLEIVNELLRRRAMPPIDGGRYRAVFGFPLRDYCLRLGFDLRCGGFEQISDEFTELYEARRVECALQPGVRTLLALLATEDRELALLSAYGESKLRELVTFYDLQPSFSQVIGMDNDYGEGKVERGRRYMRESAWSAPDMLYVGDTLHDVEVAKAMGIDCLLVEGGHQSRERLEASGCQVAANLDELARMLCGEQVATGRD